MSNVEGFFCVTCGKDVPHDHAHTGKLLPPFHRPMDTPTQCHLANDRIAELEAENKRLQKDCLQMANEEGE